MPELTISDRVQRRVVLVDFDWQDADLMPALLQRPEVSVRLVAGSKQDDAGIRLAELCGLPRTVDLADLTREIFDVALVSERSPRRTQIEGLFLALGTPSVSPQSFLEGEPLPGHSTPAVEAPLELHAAAFETSIGGEDFDSLIEQALPDVSPEAPTVPQPVRLSGQPRIEILSLDDFPSPADRQGLEAALRLLMTDTGAGRAELHLGAADHLELVAEVGPQDTLLKGLIGLAVEAGTAQVVTPMTGPDEGKAWGAWPFRTSQRRGVLAAAKIDPGEKWTTWQRTVEELRSTWDVVDREKVGAAFPLVPEPGHGWLDVDEFSMRLELALERNRRDGMRFALHRLDLPASPEAMDRLCEQLPNQLRDTDCICRPTRKLVLLLTASPRDMFPYLRRRIHALWEKAWNEAGNEPPLPGISDEKIEMTGAEDSEAFLVKAGSWLSG